MIWPMVLQIGLYAILPFFFVYLKGNIRRIVFYTYLGTLLVLSNLFKVLYRLPISSTISISGGTVVYAALIMTVIIMSIVERDPSILRTVIFLVIILNLFYFALFNVINITLQDMNAVNPYNIPGNFFLVTLNFLIVSSILLIGELLLLVFVFEKLKVFVKNRVVLIFIYIFSYIGILALDGSIYPVLVNLDPTLSEMMIGPIEGKLIVAGVFVIPILVFCLLFWKDFSAYTAKSFSFIDLIRRSKLELISEIESEKKSREEAEIKTQQLQSLAIMSGGIAHDFNNILAAISGNAYLLDEDLKDLTSGNYDQSILSSIEESVTALKNSVKRGIGLSDQLLLFAKLEKPQKKTFPLVKWIKETVNLALTGSNVSCRVNSEFDELSLLADPKQISQVLINFVINAKQAMPKGGDITIFINKIEPSKSKLPYFDQIPEINKPYIAVAVKDCGTGITPENLTKIFDPYFSTKKRGKGLGLSISKSIIENHDGFIHIESKIDIGTIIAFFLPYIENLELEQEVSYNGERLKKSLSILIMDDDENFLFSLSRLMSKLGHRVVACIDDMECIETYKKMIKSHDKVDLAFLDLTSKKGLSGIDTLNELKKYSADIKAVALSGYHDSDIMSSPEKYGFIDAIVKPFSLEELEILLKNIYIHNFV